MSSIHRHLVDIESRVNARGTIDHIVTCAKCGRLDKTSTINDARGIARKHNELRNP